MNDEKITDKYAIELLRRAKKSFFDFDKVQLALDRAIEILEAQSDRHTKRKGVD